MYFDCTTDITDPRQLYGRDALLETMTEAAERRSMLSIIGPRRFGKTCVFRTVEKMLRENPRSAAYPLYIDCKQYGDTKEDDGNHKFFCHLSARMAAQMVKDGIAPVGEAELSWDVTLNMVPSETNLYSQMMRMDRAVHLELPELLTDYLAEHDPRKRYLLLLIDETDYLLTEVFSHASQFAPLRTLATKSDGNMKFWISCLSSWSDFCSDIGSPELNGGLSTVYARPIDRAAFDRMWADECASQSKPEVAKGMAALCDSAFRLSGGVPFFAKLAAQDVLNNYSTRGFVMPGCKAVYEHLDKIYKNQWLNDEERKTLLQLADGPRKFAVRPNSLERLESKSLVRETAPDGTYALTIGFMTEYLKGVAQENNGGRDPELEELVNVIEKLRTNVNKVYGCKVFDPDDRLLEYLNTLWKPCNDKNSLCSFASALSMYYYEGSGNTVNIGAPFERDRFCHLVSKLRHYLNHDNYVWTNVYTKDMLYQDLEIDVTGLPYEPQHYRRIQLLLLKKLKDQLEKIIASRPQTAPAAPTETPAAPVAPAPAAPAKPVTLSGQLVSPVAVRANSTTYPIVVEEHERIRSLRVKYPCNITFTATPLDGRKYASNIKIK